MTIPSPLGMGLGNTPRLGFVDRDDVDIEAHQQIVDRFGQASALGDQQSFGERPGRDSYP